MVHNVLHPGITAQRTCLVLTHAAIKTRCKQYYVEGMLADMTLQRGSCDSIAPP